MLEDKRTILTVNDIPDQLELMGILLRKAGYKILTAGDGREGFEVAQREHPDMVVSDVTMPRADGIEMCRRLRAMPEFKMMPILLVSAVRKDSASAVEGLRAGADDYLEAPYDPMHLIAKVTRLLERKQTEEELLRSEERYRSLFEDDLTGDFIATPNGKLLACNHAFCRIFGFHSVEEALQTKMEEMFPHPQAYLDLLDKLRSDKRLEYIELELCRRDGSHVLAVENIIGTFDRQGRLTEIKGYIFDDTRRRELELQLLQTQKMEAIGKLAGGVAHDFNNLLTAINGYSDLTLLRLKEGDPLRRNIEEIKKAGKRAALLTRQLLAFSRKQVLQPVKLNLNNVVAEIEEMMRRLIGEHLELHTILDPALGNVSADPSQIEQVIMNLVLNARDAMTGHGKITIKTSNMQLDAEYAGRHLTVKPGPFVMLSVSDTGHGMDWETQKQIFEPFFTTKGSGKGTGLGLSTVYGIVKQSGGSIWVYSELNRGTTFKVYLPRAGEDAVVYERSAQAKSIPQGTETILLVEDEESVRKLVCEVLRLNGYQVFEAESVTAAFSICRAPEEKIDLLLTDVIMPEMSGRELADQLTEQRPLMRVLYMSGYTMQDTIGHHGVLDPGMEFLEKPFTHDALARKVREVLDQE